MSRGYHRVGVRVNQIMPEVKTMLILQMVQLLIMMFLRTAQEDIYLSYLTKQHNRLIIMSTRDSIMVTLIIYHHNHHNLGGMVLKLQQKQLKEVTL